MSTEIKKFSAFVPNCWMNCRLYAHVRDGKLVQTAAAPFPDPSYNRICLRGLTHPQRVNSKERILHPMKRVGKRGENKFEQITWDEAIDILATNLNRIREKYGSKAVAFIPWSGSYAAFNGGMPGAIKRFGCRRALSIWQAGGPASFWDRNRKNYAIPKPSFFGERTLPIRRCIIGTLCSMLWKTGQN